jgi:hypothetical protein
MLGKRKRNYQENSVEYKLVKDLQKGMQSKCLSLGNSLPNRLKKKYKEFTHDDQID